MARHDWEEWKPLVSLSRLDVVISLLGDRDSQTRQAAFAGLRSIGPEAVPFLMDACHKVAFRETIAELLGEIGDPRAIPTLVQRLQDSKLTARLAAIEALASLRTAEAVSALIEALQDSDLSVARAAAEALVAAYMTGQLPEETKHLILQQRNFITAHRDIMGQNEFGCPKHEDEGLGIMFPL